MKRFAPFLGVIAALVVAIGFVNVAPVGAVQTDATAQLTIHNRICPEGFSGPDYYGACHDTAPNPGLPFYIIGPETDSTTTDAHGDVTFAALTAGDYTVSGGVPGEFAGVTYFCAEADALTVAYPFTETATGIMVALPAGANILCDWYNTPINLSGLQTPTPVVEPATLEVYAAICPAGYKGGSYFNDCFENAADAGSVAFSLPDAVGDGESQPVGSDGHARFTNLTSGVYVLIDSLPGDALDGRFVYCTFDGTDPQTFALGYTQNAITLTIAAGQKVACDWYILPADLRGQPVPTATTTVVTGGVVVDLPNTGSGEPTVSGVVGTGFAGYIVLLASSLVAGAAMLLLRSVRPTPNGAKIRAFGTHPGQDARQ